MQFCYILMTNELSAIHILALSWILITGDAYKVKTTDTCKIVLINILSNVILKKGFLLKNKI